MPGVVFYFFYSMLQLVAMHHKVLELFQIYAAYGYPDERCYVVRRVRTPVGYRLRIINLCV
jgi:hypothetical protein